ncbi:hypothetical protein I302_101754 [Kwoniella bestiolae CBS 10118]|uniref:Uncharacterized protein n=1 Tax=Kwoniella bestiolae CBS 10118 TaxID=1296100 RepID=A0AAJ8M6T8_9TREE
MNATLTTNGGLQLPPQIFLKNIHILLVNQHQQTLASLQRCSKAHYTFVSPYLYKTLTLNVNAINHLLIPLAKQLNSDRKGQILGNF